MIRALFLAPILLLAVLTPITTALAAGDVHKVAIHVDENDPAPSPAGANFMFLF